MTFGFRGTVSAITPNSEPLPGSSTRQVSNSMTMQSTLSCSSRLGNFVILLLKQPARKKGSERRPAKTRKVPSGVDDAVFVIDDKAKR